VAKTSATVREVNAEELAVAIESTERLIVLYYEPSSSCAKMEAVLDLTVDTLDKQYNPPVEVVKINMYKQENKALEKELFGGLTFYPSVTFRKKGEPHEFLSASSEEDPEMAWLLNQVRRALLPPGADHAVSLENEDDVRKLTAQQKAVAIGMYPKKGTRAEKNFQAVAKLSRLAHIAFAVTTSREVMRMFDCKPNSVVVLNKHVLPTRVIEMSRKAMKSESDHIQFLSKCTMNDFHDFRPWSKEYQNVLRPGDITSRNVMQKRENGKPFTKYNNLVLNDGMEAEELKRLMDAYMARALATRNTQAFFRPTVLGF